MTKHAMTGHAFTLEQTLLITCCQVVLNPARPSELQTLVQQKPDWELVVSLALEQGVMPLVYEALSQHCRDTVPATILERLEHLYLSNSLRNQGLAQVMLELMSKLPQEGVATTAYKGPMLALSAYGDLGLRQMSDLDIFILKKDALKVRSLMLAWGFQLKKQRDEASERQRLRTGYHYNFEHVERRLIVEIHWSFNHADFALPLEVAPLWQRREVRQLSGSPVHVFSHDDMLLLLCIHGLRHHWYTLSQIADVAALLRTSHDWPSIMQRARQEGCYQSLVLGLALARDLFQSDLPGWNETEVLTSTRSLRGRVYHYLFQLPRHFPIARYLLWIRARERFKDKSLLTLLLAKTLVQAGLKKLNFLRKSHSKAQ
jgi:Uncharacterised nucleotidyltransferase